MNAGRLVRKLALIVAVIALAAFTISCTPPKNENTTPGPGDEGVQKQPETEDLVFEGLDEIKLTGLRFVPEGFGRPGMARVKLGNTKLTLDKQRKKFAAAKPAKKSKEAKILITLLWEAAKAEEDDDKANTLRTEARDALRETQTALGDQADAHILQMLFAAEVWAGDDQSAIKVGNEILTRFAGSKSADSLIPWVAFLDLKTWQTAEAAKLVEGWTLDQLKPDSKSDYLRAYVLAWVKFRQRAYDDAKKAVVWAAQNWGSRGTRPAIERDLVLILSRTGTPLEEAEPILDGLAKGTQDPAGVNYVLLYKLYEGYELSGYPVLAATALEKALTVLGDKVPPDNRVAIRQRQSNNYLVAHMPDKAADALIAAYKAVAPCGDPCKGKDAEIAEVAKKLGPHFHNTYTVTQDEAYYGPAEKLYSFYISLGKPDAATSQGYLQQLKETKQRAIPNTGKHNKDTMAWSTAVRNQSIQACYESVLQSETELKGGLKLVINIDDAGKVTGGETDPAGGDAGIAAVAKCANERARGWTFPARTKKGVTAVVRNYVFEPK